MFNSRLRFNWLFSLCPSYETDSMTNNTTLNRCVPAHQLDLVWKNPSVQWNPNCLFSLLSRALQSKICFRPVPLHSAVTHYTFRFPRCVPIRLFPAEGRQFLSKVSWE